MFSGLQEWTGLDRMSQMPPHACLFLSLHVHASPVAAFPQCQARFKSRGIAFKSVQPCHCLFFFSSWNKGWHTSHACPSSRLQGSFTPLCRRLPPLSEPRQPLLFQPEASVTRLPPLHAFLCRRLSSYTAAMPHSHIFSSPSLFLTALFLFCCHCHSQHTAAAMPFQDSTHVNEAEPGFLHFATVIHACLNTCCC